MTKFSRYLSALLLGCLMSGHALAQSLVQQSLSAPGNVPVSLSSLNAGTITVQATGGATMGASFQVSDDQTNWIGVTGNALPGGSSTSSASGDGYWAFNVSGHRFFRVSVASITGTEAFTTFATPGNANLNPGNATSPSNVTITPSAASTAGLAPIVSTSAESSRVLKSTAGNLYGLTVVPTASGYVMIFDATTAPADGAVTPKFCLPVAANSAGNITARNIPAAFATGIVAVYSSTGCFTKTGSATAMFIGMVN